MILVRVGQDKSDQVPALFLQKGDVGHDQIDAGQMLLVTERNAEVNGKQASLMAVAEPVDRQVHADLADPAERRKCEFVGSGHQAEPAELDAASPKNTSPEAMAWRRPSAVVTMRRPASSIV